MSVLLIAKINKKRGILRGIEPLLAPASTDVRSAYES